MPFGRKIHNGAFFGGSDSFDKRRDSICSEISSYQHAASKRTNKNIKYLSESENIFTIDDSIKDRYLITYADLITLLLGLFIILYSFSTLDLKKFENFQKALGGAFGISDRSYDPIEAIIKGKVSEPMVIEIPEIKENVYKLLQQLIEERSAFIAENDQGLRISIADKLLFAPGSAELNENSKKVLKQIADILRGLPNKIIVEGHTDDTPIKSSVYSSNWHLSAQRALNAAYFLIESEGLSPQRISIAGYAEFKPLTTNDTPEGRAKNRRVDIVILKN